MKQEEIAQLQNLLRKYIKTYIEPDNDITDQARNMYAQVLNWIILANLNRKQKNGR